MLISVESDYEGDLADVMEDSDSEFVAEDNEDKYESLGEEDTLLHLPNYNQSNATAHESNSACDTIFQNYCLSEEKENTKK